MKGKNVLKKIENQQYSDRRLIGSLLCRHKRIMKLKMIFKKEYSILTEVTLHKSMQIIHKKLETHFKIPILKIYCQGTMGLAIYDNIKRLIILSSIQLSGGHCSIDYVEYYCHYYRYCLIPGYFFLEFDFNSIFEWNKNILFSSERS